MTRMGFIVQKYIFLCTLFQFLKSELRILVSQNKKLIFDHLNWLRLDGSLAKLSLFLPIIQGSTHLVSYNISFWRKIRIMSGTLCRKWLHFRRWEKTRRPDYTSLWATLFCTTFFAISFCCQLFFVLFFIFIIGKKYPWKEKKERHNRSEYTMYADHTIESSTKEDAQWTKIFFKEHSYF